MSDPTCASAYIVAARRTALGRVGGLHARRRIEQLAAPVVEAVLADAGVEAALVDEILVGNATAGGNPARIIALAAGLPETTAATTFDKQCASGLEAILAGIRMVAQGDAEIIVAGGAESLSTAPWRVAKPRALHQLPYFLDVQPGWSRTFSDGASDGEAAPVPVRASEALAKKRNISRARQDAYAFASGDRAIQAREARRFVGEIVPLRGSPAEARDESLAAHDADDYEEQEPFMEQGGTLTPANTSVLHDGAAFVMIVSEVVWQRLGRPPALKLVAAASRGVLIADEAEAPIAAVEVLYKRLNGFDRSRIGVVEMAETSAAQAIALAEAIGFDETRLNPMGGAVQRGHPFGASGAVLVVRLFTDLVRARDGEPAGASGQCGIVTQGAVGGLGVAALFEAVG